VLQPSVTSSPADVSASDNSSYEVSKHYVNRFYRAMHVVKARYCYRKSSVRDVDVSWEFGHIGWTWTSSKLITRIISPRVFAARATTSAIEGNTLNFGWNRGGVVLSRKPTISMKRGKIGPRLLLMTNRKSHTRFRLVPKQSQLLSKVTVTSCSFYIKRTSKMF